jgi:hypothetical protein
VNLFSEKAKSMKQQNKKTCKRLIIFENVFKGTEICHRDLSPIFWGKMDSHKDFEIW